MTHSNIPWKELAEIIVATETKPKSKDVKRLSVKEFREQGYLQEMNRMFLHPLGLAMEIVVEDDGTEKLGGVWDYRDDPEGMIFADETINTDKARRKEATVMEEWDAKEKVRMEKFNYMIQPVPED